MRGILGPCGVAVNVSRPPESDFTASGRPPLAPNPRPSIILSNYPYFGVSIRADYPTPSSDATS